MWSSHHSMVTVLVTVYAARFGSARDQFKDQGLTHSRGQFALLY